MRRGIHYIDTGAVEWSIVRKYRDKDGYEIDADNLEELIALIPNGVKYTIVNEETYEPSLKETVTTALQIVRQLRKDKEYAGCISQGIKWDTDEKSERRLISAVTIMKDNPDVTAIPNFKPSKDISITLTLETAVEAGKDMMIHYGTCFSWEDAIIEKIKKCTTNKQVKDIVNSL